jgi:hypothetical protein
LYFSESAGGRAQGEVGAAYQALRAGVCQQPTVNTDDTGGIDRYLPPVRDRLEWLASEFLIGKYVTALPAVTAQLVANQSLGLFHADAGGQFGFITC